MEFPKTAKLIEDSRDYIDIDGTVYGYGNRKGHKNYNKYYKKSQHFVHGYCYCGIYSLSKGHPISTRVHRLVAKYFIENDNPIEKTYVAHRNNIKNDNRIENLFWATPSENTQQAFDDGLAINDKGIFDSQSFQVNQYDTLTNKLIAKFGSIKEATRITNISSTTICYQCKNIDIPIRKSTYFRYDEQYTPIPNKIICGYLVETDEPIGEFFSCADAERKTNVDISCISHDIKRNKKPKFITNGRNIYFLYKTIDTNNIL